MSKLAFRLALRYRRTKRRGLVKFTSLVAVLGIAVGVGGLIVAQSIGRGFEKEIRENILASAAHITVKRTDGNEITESAAIAQRIGNLHHVTSVHAESFTNAVMSSGGRDRSENVIVRVSDRDEVRNGTVVLGDRLMEKFADSRSGMFTIEFPGTGKSRQLESAGTFSTGIYDYDSTQARISPDDFAKLAGIAEFTPTSLAISIDDIYAAREVSTVIRDSLGGDYQAIDWQEANRPLFSALALERRGAMLVIGLIVLIAAVNITTTLSLLVQERRLDVAVLKTCGASGATIVQMFLFEGMILSMVGTAIGCVAGVLACFASNRLGLLELPAEVYSVSRIQLDPAAGETLLICLCSLAIALIASLVPSVTAILTKPSENLRRT